MALVGAEANGARLDAVLRLLKVRTSATIDEMAAQFRVSGMTIRRDLQRFGSLSVT